MGKKRTKRLHFFFITHSTLVLIGLTWCLSVNKTFSVLVAAALAFLAAVVFGSEIEKYSSVSLNWGFAFDIIGGIFLCGAATAFFVEYMRHRWVRSCLFEVSTGAIPRGRQGSGYGVVPKGLLAFLGSLYKEVAKTASGTWCIASRDKPPEKKSSFEKHCVLDLECRILSQEPSDSCILYFSVIFYGK